MYRLKIIFSFFVMMFFSLNAEIYETSHFEDLTHYIKPESLVILDIDDTLLIPAQTLGNDVWFQERLYFYKQQNMHSALEKALAEWEAVRQLTVVKLVEENTAKVVEELQQSNVKVMGLTTQGLSLATCTINQLLGLGIDLKKSSPYAEDYYFMNGQGVLYRQGILFTAGSNKGKALLNFLDFIDCKPHHIVFINDKHTHLKDVEKSLMERDIAFTGLRYNYGDERVQNYRSDIAKIQWEKSHFSHILSDEEALLLLKEN